MFKKLIYLVSFVFVLSIAINAQAAPLPVSVDPAVEAVIGADALAPPDQAYNTYNLQICNYTSGRRVTLVSYDISGLLKDGQMFDNMSLSNLGIFAGGVDVYGVIEDQDNISGGLKWNNAPGVNNGQPIGYPVDLDKDDLSAKLLSFTAPGNNERKSTGTSQALDDFINSDTDGIVTFLLAPPKAGQNVLMKSGKYSDGGTILNGEITTGIDIIWVTDADDTGLIDRDGDGVQDDQDWIDFLNAELHNVDARLGNWMSLDDAKLAELNAADLVILSRTASSGDYDDDDEVAQWSSVTTPLISLSAWHLRSSRWKWIDSGDTQRSNMSYMEVLVPTHPIFEGVEIDADGLVEPVDPEIYSEPNGYQGTCFVNSIDMGNGVLLAKNLLDMAWIAIWKAGVEYYDGAGVAPASRRLYFMAGTENNSLGTAVIPQGDWNLTAAGETMFRNSIKYMTDGPRDAWPYTYDGDAAEYGTGDFDSLDGTWDRQNSSDAWDGSAPGDPDVAAGGAGVFTEDGVTFLRIQDAGNPNKYGFSDPGNRKVYFGRDIMFGLNGSMLEFRIRLATAATGPIDDLNVDDGSGIIPFPEGGDGHVIADRGKGMVGIGEADALGMISFSLAKPDEIAAYAGFEDVATDVLVMNNLVGTESSEDVDTGDGNITAVNYLALDDATAWNTFTVNIAAGGTGTHVVSVSVNGGDAQSFDVTVGADNDIPGNYIALGVGNTGLSGAFDVDYITYK